MNNLLVHKLENNFFLQHQYLYYEYLYINMFILYVQGPYINTLKVKSITLEENLIILDLFLTLKIKTEKELIVKKEKVMKKLNKLIDEDFRHNIKLLIDNINTLKLEKNLFVNKNLNYE